MAASTIAQYLAALPRGSPCRAQRGAQAGSTISRVTFGGPFESDNHSFLAAPAQGVPENGSSIALFATSASGLVAMRRRLQRA